MEIIVGCCISWLAILIVILVVNHGISKKNKEVEKAFKKYLEKKWSKN